MKLNTKVLIDKWLGAGILRLLLLIGHLSRREHAADAIRPQDILVMKLLGLGSIIQATPFLTALRSLHPNARITFITTRGNEQLTTRIPVIDRTLTIRDEGLIPLSLSIIRLLREIRHARNALVINLEAHSKIGAILTMLSGARWKAGFFRNTRDLSLSTAFDRLVYFNPSAPISEVYLQLGRTLGFNALSPPLSEIHGTADDDQEAEAFLGSVEVSSTDARLVLVNPNASELRLERRWDAAHFAQAITALAHTEPDLRFVLIGLPAERAHVETILEKIPRDLQPRVFNGAGHVSLGGLIAVIRRASLLITNDSGPMHIALSLGIPIVGLFGPVDPDHYTTTDTEGASRFLYHRTYCSPCVHHFEIAPCGGNNICMKRITVWEVVAAAHALLRADGARSIVDRQISYTDQGRPIGVVGMGA
jgi:ADP-heptose:LPS heptosyltransferase